MANLADRAVSRGTQPGPPPVRPGSARQRRARADRTVVPNITSGTSCRAARALKCARAAHVTGGRIRARIVRAGSTRRRRFRPHRAVEAWRTAHALAHACHYREPILVVAVWTR
eukprot:1609029-Prymnesium_polylepis.6